MNEFIDNQEVANNHKQLLTIPLADIPTQSTNWMAMYRIPEGEITLLAGDGGVGKSTIACEIVCSVSTGKPYFLDPRERTPGNVLILSGEEDPSRVIKPRIEKAGADMERIFVVKGGRGADRTTIGSEQFEALISERKLALCLIDPIQSFVPSGMNMSARNQMRCTTDNLAKLSEKYGTTFLIICHTNKRENASGRNRISDSSDLYDAARSVLVVGATGQENVRYLSHEKSNYSLMQDTLLVSLEGGKVTLCGTTKNKDRDYVLCGGGKKLRNPVLEKCMLEYVEVLRQHNGTWDSEKVKQALYAAHFGKSVVQKAVHALKVCGLIAQGPVGGNSDRKWVARIVEQEKNDNTP